MKDAKEALYCMGQMADKCLTSLGAIQKDYNDFVSLVKKMRDAQIEAENCIHEDYDLCVERVDKADRLEREVDEYLKKIE